MPLVIKATLLSFTPDSVTTVDYIIYTVYWYYYCYYSEIYIYDTFHLFNRIFSIPDTHKHTLTVASSDFLLTGLCVYIWSTEREETCFRMRERGRKRKRERDRENKYREGGWKRRQWERENSYSLCQSWFSRPGCVDLSSESFGGSLAPSSVGFVGVDLLYLFTERTSSANVANSDWKPVVTN